ncbi:MAG TPA: site-specific integrase, partial [Lachnospiraceae bacterium]|nr:site-specific integrase [Lachnospiraceae bacterium]
MLGFLRGKERRRVSERKRDQKRRDKKGRILRNGESQRTDGRYAFVYTDCFGKQKFLYSWKLESTDPLPAGCRPCKSLSLQIESQ